MLTTSSRRRRCLSALSLDHSLDPPACTIQPSCRDHHSPLRARRVQVPICLYEHDDSLGRQRTKKTFWRQSNCGCYCTARRQRPIRQHLTSTPQKWTCCTLLFGYVCTHLCKQIVSKCFTGVFVRSQESIHQFCVVSCEILVIFYSLVISTTSLVNTKHATIRDCRGTHTHNTCILFWYDVRWKYLQI